MRIIARKTIIGYWTAYPTAREGLEGWLQEAENAEWDNSHDVKAKFGKASILKDGRVVFNICNNDFRLVVRIHYKAKIIYIRFFGTHEEYDEIDAQTI
jgi:mRNA interferase HigB